MMYVPSLSPNLALGDTGLSDRIILDIGDAIETEEQVEKLGQALGISRADVNKYLATNRLDGRVTSKGTRDMLFTWRENTSPMKHKETLQTALQESGLVLLGHRYLNTLVASPGKESLIITMTL